MFPIVPYVCSSNVCLFAPNTKNNKIEKRQANIYVSLWQLRQSKPVGWPSTSIRKLPHTIESALVLLFCWITLVGNIPEKSFKISHSSAGKYIFRFDNLPAMGFHQIRAKDRNRYRTKTFSRQSRQSNPPPCPKAISRVDLSKQKVCTSTGQWICKTVEWHRCRRQNIIRRKVYRKRQYRRRKWQKFPSPCR